MTTSWRVHLTRIHKCAKREMEEKNNSLAWQRPEILDPRLLVYCDYSTKTQKQKEITQLLNLPGLLKVLS